MAVSVQTTTEPLPTGALLARLGQDATARFRRALRPLDLGAQQFIVLKQLQVMGGTSQAALADAVGVDYSNLASLAAELFERKLIARSRAEDDRRRYVLDLTPAGSRLLVRAERAIAEGETEMLAALDDDEREQFYGLLRRVADSAELCPAAVERACAE
jgi:MarR family transcriptional regulator, lower aerobic nicotinate degradation pathway regulator